ncbi:hypothetical protein ACOJBO_02920 [Rhizobium beringeri]
MAGSGTFAVQAAPNMTAVFTPHPNYWVMFGNFETGDVIDIEDVTGAVEVTYGGALTSRTAALGLDNLIHGFLTPFDGGCSSRRPLLPNTTGDGNAGVQTHLHQQLKSAWQFRALPGAAPDVCAVAADQPGMACAAGGARHPGALLLVHGSRFHLG